MTPDNLYRVHTVEDGARRSDLFDASGKKTGHGTIAWLPAPRYEMKPSPPWRPVRRRPVIALLDSGVREHGWLPEPVDGQPFCIDAGDTYGWQPPVPIPALPEEDFGSHWGHATFLAGLIRLAAPDAQVLSMRVMSSMGEVIEENAIAALTWLAAHAADAGIPDVVLMAFGRRADAVDAGLAKVGEAVQALAKLGVRIVASAGNESSERPVYPAAFAGACAADPKPSVVSVGARVSATERAPYSDYGVWVREWREGTNVVSIMPLLTKDIGGDAAAHIAGDGYAYWSGTSFAAAAYAGALAQQVMADEPLPAQVAAP